MSDVALFIHSTGTGLFMWAPYLETTPPGATALTPANRGYDATDLLPCGEVLGVFDEVEHLLLAAKIHGTHELIKATAKRCAKQLPRSKRDLMFSVIDSSNPLLLVDFLAKNLD